MKYIANEEGRSLQLIAMEEVRPLRGGVYPLDLLTKIRAKYEFLIAPERYDPIKSTKFENGFVRINSITISILTLEIYSDGILVVTRSTEDSDLVLDDLMQWAKTEFNLREPSTLVPRSYVSRIVVDIDGQLEGLVKVFSVMANTVSDALRSPGLSLIQLQIGPFPQGQYPYQRTWTLTRRVSDPPIPTRYVSSAPLATPTHYEFLVSVEGALQSA